MRQQAKAAGGRWDPRKRLWFVKYGRIAGTQLEKHIQVDEKCLAMSMRKHLQIYTKAASTGRCLNIPVDECIYM
jgi:hypothetical protein